MIRLLTGADYSQADIIRKLSQNMPHRNFYSLTSQIEEMAKVEDSYNFAKKLDIVA